ncbi:MAG: dihydrolipoyl dehydrogenase family protein [Planctomycetota bacterium]|jgi:dihydrolipoamide dehydrogenase
MVVGEFTQEADLVVIGGGPGGYTAAFRAAELGMSTMIVDPRPQLGGVCLHEGCVPSKTLLHVSESIHLAEHCRSFGVGYDQPRIDLDALRAWQASTINKLAAGLESLCGRHDVQHVIGRAHFEDSRTLAIIEGPVPRIRFRRALVATGSCAVEHEALPFSHPRIISPTTAMGLAVVPPRVLVLGNQYMTVELAGIYSALGSDVTLVDAGPCLLPETDCDLVRPLQRQVGEQLANTWLSTTITGFRDVPDGIEILFDGEAAPDSAVFDLVIVVIGQSANIDCLALDHTSVILDGAGHITVDEQLRTSDPRIYAAGDVTGPPLLADRAIHQGRVAAESIAGWKSAFDPRAVPFAVFTDPQLAWCGLTEARATAEEIPHAVSKTPWGASGRAVGMGRVQGVTKILYDPDTKLVLGVGLTGPHAAELIAEGALAIEMGAELDDLAATIHPHPTLSELLSDTARAAVNDVEPGPS